MLFSSPRSTARFLHDLLCHETVEVFLLLCLDTRHHLIGHHELSRGILDAALVHPREVYKVAILANAASIILAHNHPSGDPTPSHDDRDITKQIVSAGSVGCLWRGSGGALGCRLADSRTENARGVSSPFSLFSRPLQNVGRVVV